MSDDGWPRHDFPSLDEQKADLEARFPSWRIWFVVLATGGETWCAQRKPALTEASATDLVKGMLEVEADAQARVIAEIRAAEAAAGAGTGPV
jgi:hypothetical protein